MSKVETKNCFSSSCASLTFKASFREEKKNIFFICLLFSTCAFTCSKWWNTCSGIPSAGFWFSLITRPYWAARTFEIISLLIRHFQRFLEIGRGYWWWAPPCLFVAALRIPHARHICTCLNISKSQWWGEKKWVAQTLKYDSPDHVAHFLKGKIAKTVSVH